MKRYRDASILIVDDDEDDFFILSGLLKDIPANTFRIEWAPTFSDGVRKLCATNYNIAFVDYRLGARSGVDFLKEVRDLKASTPIILLTGQGNYAVDLEAMELGAVDYLIKAELTAEKVERCIRYTVDRAATLQALRESEQKYRSIFEKSRDIIFVATHTGIITDINSAVTQLLGFEPASIVGRPLADLMYREDDRYLIDDVLAKRSDIVDITLHINKSDGSSLIAALSLSWNEPDGDGYIQGILHDMTNLKKAEKATLNNEKLAATSRLVRTLAHEVRNPLNNISMSADQLSREISSDDHPLYLDIIKRNSVRINNLITELLHAQLPRDNARKKCTLQDVIEEVLPAATDRLTLKRMHLQTEICREPLSIMADRENLKIALLNIIINAIEAMKEDDGQLVVTVLKVDEKPTVIITDNGCGISEDKINLIFEPYYTGKKGGTGLGLAFTLNIIRTHNATMDVSSTPGRGTSFTITFPDTES